MSFNTRSEAGTASLLRNFFVALGVPAERGSPVEG